MERTAFEAPPRVSHAFTTQEAGASGAVCPQTEPVTDKAVDFLIKGSHLQELDLCRTEITNQGIARLARLPELHSVTMGGKSVTSEAISALGPMGGNLKSLTIEDVPLNETDLMKIKSFPRLEFVSLNNTRVSAELAFQCLDKPGHLDLTVDGQDFDMHDFDVYLRNGIRPSATGVCLKAFPWNTKRLETLRGHANLKSLRVEGKFDWLSILEIAATIANLEDLTIEPTSRFGKTSNDVSVIVPASAPCNPNLRSVYFSDLTITPAFLEWISRHKKLDSVRFYQCVFETQDLSKLNELSGLKNLSFDDCNIGDQAVESLDIPMLRSLDLDHTSVTDAVIDSILRMTKLTSIGLHAKGVSKAAAMRLRQKLSRDTYLHDGN